jgi:hypothetical protein
VISNWLGLRQAQGDLRVPPPPGFPHSFLAPGPADASWTSPRILSFLVLLVVVATVQIVLVWSRWTIRHWWVPIVIETGLSMAFAVTGHQVIGSISSTCTSAGSGPESCSTALPPLYPGGWFVVIAVIGLGLGTLWSLSGRARRRHHESMPSPPAGSPGPGTDTAPEEPEFSR